MSKLMELPDVKISTSRSGFDMSSRLLYSAKAGEMLPVFVQEMIPSEKKKITFQWFTRTQPLDTAAYTRLREYIDFYFVPYEQLWKQWKMFALQMNDNAIYASDVNTQQMISDKHPYFTVKQVADFLYKVNHSSGSSAINCLGYNRAQLSCKLLEYLGYGDFTPYLDKQYIEPEDSANYENMINVPLNPFPLLAYQKIYQDKIRNSQWEKSAPYTYNLDYIKGDNDLQIPVESIDVDSRISMFELQYMNWNKDYYMGLLPNSQFGDEAVVPININPNPTTNSYYVGTEYLYTNIGSRSVNGDDVIFKGDYTTPRPDVNAYTLAGKTNQDEVGLMLPGTLRTQMFQGAIDGLSILLLRQYEMLQRYREVQQSAPTDYKSQIEKLFGVNLTWKDSNQVRWIGGVARNIDINDVVNTNLESEGSRTTIHGKGVGAGDGSVSFDTVGDYGLVIGIYHVMPVLEYSLNAPYKLNTKFRFSDYAQPAFDKIGLQAITAPELFNSPVFIRYLRRNGLTQEQIASLVIGYGPRYLDYKTQVDRVVGVFKTSEKSWCAPLSDEYWLQYNSSYDIASPELPDVAINSTQLFNYTTFKINPAILNNIFAVYVGSDGSSDISSAVDSSVDTDQFICNLYCKVDDVKNLDYDGMPY